MYNKTKTQSAWRSVNKFLKDLRGLDIGGEATAIKTDLVTRIMSLTETSNYFAALGELAQSAGATSITLVPQDVVQTWIDTGIPLEAWIGKLLYDTYTKGTSPSGKVTYKADHSQAAALFSEQLRDVFRTYRLWLRMAEDVANVETVKEGNPGGIADASKGN